jgi:uncharacterized protein (DUF885 family)
MSAQEAHALGLREVARIRGEMMSVVKQVGYRGTLQEFFQKLRSDELFYYKTPEHLLSAYRARAKEIDPLVVKLLKTLPRLPYGIEPIKDPGQPGGYRLPECDGSRPGLFMLSVTTPHESPKYEMTAILLHETVPGHHLQNALACEHGESGSPHRREFRQNVAFTEGWALYAESLGDGLSLYSDPYDRFGRLVMGTKPRLRYLSQWAPECAIAGANGGGANLPVIPGCGWHASRRRPKLVAARHHRTDQL